MDLHLEQLAIVLQSILDDHFYLKESKCSFGQDNIEYIGHIVCSKGVKPENTKVQAVKE